MRQYTRSGDWRTAKVLRRRDLMMYQAPPARISGPYSARVSLERQRLPGTGNSPLSLAEVTCYTQCRGCQKQRQTEPKTVVNVTETLCVCKLFRRALSLRCNLLRASVVGNCLPEIIVLHPLVNSRYRLNTLLPRWHR